MHVDSLISKAAHVILAASHLTAFTGAGISVESGIPPFRGEGGLWDKYDPALFELDYFLSHQSETWALLREVFYRLFDDAQPNKAHQALADLEKMGLLATIITQNIDYLHQRAGNKTVIEFHGTAQTVICLRCRKLSPFDATILRDIPPVCPSCGGIIKPNFIFFGEGIPQQAMQASIVEAMTADVVLIIGTTGEVYPAAMVPMQAKERGATIIEVNTEPSSFTCSITDIFLQGMAGPLMSNLVEEIKTMKRTP